MEDDTNSILQYIPNRYGQIGETQTSNWRPIAILPTLYKLFAKLLYIRLSPVLFQHQSFDQHAFIPGRRIEDAHLCAEIITEYALEFQLPIWILSMDLKKAFDWIDHITVFNGLRQHCIPEEYVNLIILLYSNQTGNVNNSKTTNKEILWKWKFLQDLLVRGGWSQINYIEEIPTYVVSKKTYFFCWCPPLFFLHSIFDDYITPPCLDCVVLQTKGSNHIFIIFISTSPIVDDEDDGGDYGDDDYDDGDIRKLG